MSKPLLIVKNTALIESETITDVTVTVTIVCVDSMCLFQIAQSKAAANVNVLQEEHDIAKGGNFATLLLKCIYV